MNGGCGQGLCAFAIMLTAALGCAARVRADYIDHFAARDDIGILKVPHEGITRVLVLPVIVDDLPITQGSEAAFLEEMRSFFDPDADGWAFTPYWVTQSLGRFRPEATVAAPIHMPACPRLGAYADCEIPRGAGIASGDVQGAALVIRDALRFLDEIFVCALAGPGGGRACTSGGGVDLAAFDTSGLVAGAPDGVVDGVVLISNAGFPGIALPVRELATNPLLQSVGPFPSFVYDDVTVGAVAIAGAASAPRRSTAVSVHEFGHLLGFADLYNESGTTTDMPYTLMGGWSYDTEGSLLDGFSRIAIGWGHVMQASGAGTFTLRPADTHGTVLKVGTGDEFFLVELRRKTPGRTDGDLQVDRGVVVERVRLQKRPRPERGNYLGTLAQCVNCTVFDTFLSIEQADGRFDLEAGRVRDDESDLFDVDDVIEPSDNVAPRSLDNSVLSTNRYDGEPTGVRLRVVSVSRDAAVVAVDGPAVEDACLEIAEWCGALACVSLSDDAGVAVGAECGRVPDPPDPPAGEEELPAGCGCHGTSGGELMALVLVPWALRRHPRSSWITSAPTPSQSEDRGKDSGETAARTAARTADTTSATRRTRQPARA